MTKKEPDPQRIRQTLIHALQQSSDAILVVDQSDRILFFNAGAERLWGLQAEHIVGNSLRLLLSQDVSSRYQGGPCIKRLSAADASTLQLSIEHADGRTTDAMLSVIVDRLGDDALYTLLFRPQHHASDAAPPMQAADSTAASLPDMHHLSDTHQQLTHALDLLLDIAHTKTAEDLQTKLLRTITQEQPVQEIMTMLCREIERLAPGTSAMVLLHDRQSRLRPLAAPSLPVALRMAYEGMRSDTPNDACAIAIAKESPLYIGNIDADPRCTGIRTHALAAGLHAAWIHPISNAAGTVLGALVLYSRHAGDTPSPAQQSLASTCLPLCLLALEREDTREHIHQLTFYDAKTGLPNRDMVRAHVNEALQDARRCPCPLALMLIKLRRVMHPGHVQGSAAADTLRLELAQRIHGATRRSDILGQLSHDEFIVALPHCDTLQARMAAERFVNELKQPITIGTFQTLHASVSVGVSSYPDDGQDFDQLLRHADMAMMHAESEGRNTFRLFNKDMNEAAQERLQLENDLRRALQDDAVALHYQPQTHMRGADDRALLGVEALMRWPHPERGFIPPDRFIPLAEESDLIDTLAEWAIRQACRQLGDWRARGIPVPRVSVNLSALNFRNDKLPVYVSGQLALYGLQPCDLTIEVTESIMLQPDPGIAANIDALHALGILLSLDDFGTGFSSLSYLHRLPFSELKLDKSFVQDIEHSDGARALTRSVLLLGESLGLNVVAEGVETPLQRQFLAEHGCTALQGYLIAKPMPAQALEAWLQHP